MTTRVEMELHAGMRNHSYMYNRDAANQHPMSAITGLNDKLAGMGSVVEMTAFTDAMNAATVDGPAVTVTSPTTRMTTAMWNELAVGKYIIGPEGVKIFRCTAKTETSFSAVCVSVANLRGEKGDKGDTGNTGPKGDAYEITSADYEAIAEIVEDEYTEELASVKNDLRTLERKNKALTDLLNGQELRFDTESITGASIDVASGCVADSILKVCGKSIVQDGTIVSSQTDSVAVRGKNLIDNSTLTDGFISAKSGDAFDSTAYNSKKTDFIEVESSAKYYFSGMTTINNGNSGALYDSDKNFVQGISNDNELRPITIPSNVAYVRLSIWGNNFPNKSTSIAQFEKGTSATSYKPYHAPQTITTSFPVLKSAGSVSDYIDLASARPSSNAGKSIVDVVRNVGSVDLGSLSWNRTTSYANPIFYCNVNTRKTGANNNLICDMYTAVNSVNSGTFAENANMSIAFASDNGSIQMFVRNDSYTDATSFKTAMNGVMLHYELATPTTETLEIPNGLLEAINVESGGQLTFVDHTDGIAMPISTTHEWIVRNEEV